MKHKYECEYCNQRFNYVGRGGYFGGDDRYCKDHLYKCDHKNCNNRFFPALAFSTYYAFENFPNKSTYIDYDNNTKNKNFYCSSHKNYCIKGKHRCGPINDKENCQEHAIKCIACITWDDINDEGYCPKHKFECKYCHVRVKSVNYEGYCKYHRFGCGYCNKRYIHGSYCDEHSFYCENGNHRCKKVNRRNNCEEHCDRCKQCNKAP